MQTEQILQENILGSYDIHIDYMLDNFLVFLNNVSLNDMIPAKYR